MTAETSSHGYAKYTNGCRCETCRQAKADYMRRRRAEARSEAQRHTSVASGGRANGASAFSVGATRHLAYVSSHGTRFAYEERGCRCLECTRARTDSDRRYRK